LPRRTATNVEFAIHTVTEMRGTGRGRYQGNGLMGRVDLDALAALQIAETFTPRAVGTLLAGSDHRKRTLEKAVTLVEMHRGHRGLRSARDSRSPRLSPIVGAVDEAVDPSLAPTGSMETLPCI